MSRVVYVDGQYVSNRHAWVAMEDRGYQFADGIYEVVTMYDGALIDQAPHLDRLERSLRELDIPMPMSRRALELVIEELIRRNSRRNALVYMQVTRGVAQRGHVFNQGIRPVLTMAVMPAKFPSIEARKKGVKVTTAQDLRWERCDIKSVALLPNIMVRNEAERQGAKEAWQIRDGCISEGSSSNAYIVDKDGVIRTHPLTHAILGGVTRATVLKLARNAGIEVVEDPFTLNDVREASEAFLTGATTFVTPVVQVGDIQVSNEAGPVTQKLMALYDAYIKEQAV